MTATGAAMYLLLAALNLGLAWLLLGARPRRDAHVLVAALIGTNGLYAVYAVAEEMGWHRGLPEPFQDGATGLLLNLPVFAGFIALPLVFPRDRLGARGRRLLRRGVAGFVAGNVALVALWGLLVDPTLLGINGPGHVLFGPTAWIPFLLGVSLGTLLLLDAYLGERDPAVRTQVALVLSAYALKAASHWVGLGNLDAGVTPRESLGASPWTFDWVASLSTEAALAFAALAVLVAVPVARWRARARGEPRPLRDDALVLLLVGTGAALGLFADQLPGDIEYLLLRPLLLTYGLLHLELVPVDVERQRPLLAATLLAALGGAFLVTLTALAGGGIAPEARGGLALLAVAALGATLAWPLLRLTLAPLAALSGERSRELYRAALLQVVQDPSGHRATNERVLRALRERLRISEREHAALLAEAEAAAGHRDELAPGALFLGRYRVEAPLGEGGFARAFLARDERLGRPVVLKVARWTRPEETRRAMREARLLATLADAHIVAVHDVEEVAGEVVLVLEHVPGGSLADRLRRGPLPKGEALRIADGVLAALEAAHARGIVHRDVKPSNVLLTAEGDAKLADFGIAAGQRDAGTVTGSFTREGAGTLRYMAPEQARGLEADARSDLYAVGVVLYEMLAGRPYLRLDGLAEFEARRAILEEEPELPLPGAPRGVSEALRKALAKDPADRPASAAELRSLLGAGRAARPARRAA